MIRSFLILCLAATGLHGAIPAPATTPLTRQVLTNATVEGLRNALGIVSSNYWATNTYNSTNQYYTGGPVISSSNGTGTNTVLRSPMLVSGTNTGNAFESAGAGASSLQLGPVSTAVGDYSIAIGILANATNENSLALGYEAVAVADGATAIGYDAIASGEDAIAFGSASRASGVRSFAAGVNAVATNLAATSMGFGAIAGGGGSSAFGYGASAIGLGSGAFGTLSSDGGFDFSMALGAGVTNTATNQIRIGDVQTVWVGGVFYTEKDAWFNTNVNLLSEDGLISHQGYAVFYNPATFELILTNTAFGTWMTLAENLTVNGAAIGGTVASNSVSDYGTVAPGSGQVSKVWKTDADGVPAWRDDDTAISGEGIATLNGYGTNTTFRGTSADTPPVRIYGHASSSAALIDVRKADNNAALSVQATGGLIASFDSIFMQDVEVQGDLVVEGITTFTGIGSESLETGTVVASNLVANRLLMTDAQNIVTNVSAGDAGQVLTSTGDGVAWSSLHAMSFVTASGSNVLTATASQSNVQFTNTCFGTNLIVLNNLTHGSSFVIEGTATNTATVIALYPTAAGQVWWRTNATLVIGSMTNLYVPANKPWMIGVKAKVFGGATNVNIAGIVQEP